MLSMDRMQATRIAQGTGEKNKRVLAIESVKIVTSRGDPASCRVGNEEELIAVVPSTMVFGRWKQDIP